MKRTMGSFLDGLKSQARLLEEKTDGLRGRLRPVTLFAAARLSDAVRVVTDTDDGGSGLAHVRDNGDLEGSLAAAHAQMFAERISETQQLLGADLVGLLARAFNTTPKRIAADLFRLGAIGAPKRWLKLSSAGPGRDWFLTEGATDPIDNRYEAAIALDHVDWYETLSAEARPIAMPFVIFPVEAGFVHLIKVRDPSAAEVVASIPSLPEELVNACWCFVDLPAGVAKQTFGESNRGHWEIREGGPGDEPLMVHLARGRIRVLAGQDDLARFLAVDSERPIRILAAIGAGGALAHLGATIDDVSPSALME